MAPRAHADRHRTCLRPPEERAEATGAGLRDRISLRDHVVTADIGAFQQERGRPQRLRFNIVVEVRPVSDAQDDVDRILSYDRLTEAIDAELAKDRLNLLKRWPNVWPKASLPNHRPCAPSSASKSWISAPTLWAWKSCVPRRNSRAPPR